MRGCWNFDSEDRPCFATLVEVIGQQVQLIKLKKPPPLHSNPSPSYLKVL